MDTAVNKTRGFTLVELIVIIAVIGILAGITIVAYGGWQKRSAQNVVQSDLKGVAAAMENARNFSSGYPGAIPSTMQASQNVSLSYVRGTATDYCVSGTSTKISGVTYYIEPSISKDPRAGSCPSIVTNMVVNGSVEYGTTSPNSSYYSAPTTIDSSTGAYGNSSMQIVTNSTTNPQGSVWKAPGALPSTVYTCSLSLKSSTNPVVVVASRETQSDGTYISEGAGAQTVTLSPTWQRVAVTFTTHSNTGIIYIQYHLTSAQSGITIWSDGAMCTQGSTAYGYADGDSSGWSWTGTPGNSASTGPGV